MTVIGNKLFEIEASWNGLFRNSSFGNGCIENDVSAIELSNCSENVNDYLYE